MIGSNVSGWSSSPCSPRGSREHLGVSRLHFQTSSTRPDLLPAPSSRPTALRPESRKSRASPLQMTGASSSSGRARTRTTRASAESATRRATRSSPRSATTRVPQPRATPTARSSGEALRGIGRPGRLGGVIRVDISPGSIPAANQTSRSLTSRPDRLADSADEAISFSPSSQAWA